MEAREDREARAFTSFFFSSYYCYSYYRRCTVDLGARPTTERRRVTHGATDGLARRRRRRRRLHHESECAACYLRLDHPTGAPIYLFNLVSLRFYHPLFRRESLPRRASFPNVPCTPSSVKRKKKRFDFCKFFSPPFALSRV